MQNFEFLLPTKVYFGKETHLRVGKILRGYGAVKVLLHYGGGSIKQNGVYDAVTASLGDQGIRFVELGGVRPNPRLSLVREGVELCQREDVNFLLAVGGGSVIDSAKAIGLGLAHPGQDVYDFFLKKASPRAMAPVGVVLTLPAAGSETSNSCVISREEDGMKRGCGSEVLRPAFAIMNPELTYSLPPYQTACGVSDMMAHIMERYFTPTPSVELTDRLSEAALKAIIHNAPKAMEDPRDYDARAVLMWAGSIAHTDFLGVDRLGDWSSHRMEHELSALYDIAHGAGLSILFPAWMRYVYKRDPARFVQFALRVWDVPWERDEESVILAGIARMEAFFKSLGLPVRLADAGIDATQVDYLARHTEADDQGRLGAFQPLDEQDRRAIFTAAL